LKDERPTLEIDLFLNPLQTDLINKHESEK
jgi:hypothetical protein